MAGGYGAGRRQGANLALTGPAPAAAAGTATAAQGRRGSLGSRWAPAQAARESGGPNPRALTCSLRGWRSGSPLRASTRRRCTCRRLGTASGGCERGRAGRARSPTEGPPGGPTSATRPAAAWHQARARRPAPPPARQSGPPHKRRPRGAAIWGLARSTVWAGAPASKCAASQRDGRIWGRRRHLAARSRQRRQQGGRIAPRAAGGPAGALRPSVRSFLLNLARPHHPVSCRQRRHCASCAAAAACRARQGFRFYISPACLLSRLCCVPLPIWLPPRPASAGKPSAAAAPRLPQPSCRTRPCCHQHERGGDRLMRGPSYTPCSSAGGCRPCVRASRTTRACRAGRCGSWEAAPGRHHAASLNARLAAGTAWGGAHRAPVRPSPEQRRFPCLLGFGRRLLLLVLRQGAAALGGVPACGAGCARRVASSGWRASAQQRRQTSHRSLSQVGRGASPPLKVGPGLEAWRGGAAGLLRGAGRGWRGGAAARRQHRSRAKGGAHNSSPRRAWS